MITSTQQGDCYKILIVGHSYVTRFAQDKIVEMQECAKGVEVHLVIPNNVNCAFGLIGADHHPQINRSNINVIQRCGGEANITYWFRNEDMVDVLSRVRPSIVLVEEDPFSLCMFGVLLAIEQASLRPSVACFIWDNLNRKTPVWRWLLKSWLQSLTFPSINLFVCGNHSARALLHAEKSYRNASVVLPQIGVLVPEFAEREYNPPATYCVRIGFVGRLVEEKGILVLLEACSLLLDCTWSLIVVGSGDLGSTIQHTAQRFGYGDRLTLLGGVKHSEVPGILASIDVFVLPSQRTSFWEEQFGITLVQAMASGCACVGSDCGAIPYVLKDAGLIFPQKHVGKLSLALRSLLASSDLRRQFGEAARQRALSKFSSNAVAKEYMTLLTQYYKQTLINI